MHVDAVGVVPPAAYNLDAANPKPAAADRADVVDQRIAYRYPVDKDVRAVFKLNRVTANRIVYGGFVVFFICFEQNLFFIPAVVEYSPAENRDFFGVCCRNAGVYHRAGVEIKSLAAFKLDIADVMLAGAEIYDVFGGFVWNIRFRRVDEKVKRVSSAVRLKREVSRTGQGKANLAARGYLRRNSEGIGAQNRLFRRFREGNFKIQRLVRLHREELNYFGLVERALMSRPAAVVGHGGDAGGICRDNSAVDFNGIAALGRFCDRVKSYAHVRLRRFYIYNFKISIPSAQAPSAEAPGRVG